MKNYGKNFIVSVVLSAAALGLIIAGFPLYAAIPATLAFFANSSELLPYSTPYQFINLRLISLMIGVATDLCIGEGSYYYSLLLFMAPFMAIARLEFFNHMSLGKNGWVEKVSIIVTYGIYLYASLQHPARWEGWAMPLAPLLFLTWICSFNLLRVAELKGEVSEYKANIGSKAPLFELPDTTGKTVKLSDYIGRNHVLLVFIRGDWCPSCHIMIRTYEKQSEKFQAKNIVAISIGPDSREVNKEMVSRFGWKNLVLSDHLQQTAMSYGIRIKPNIDPVTEYAEGPPMPATFLVDKTGIVRYIFRPDQGEFLNPSLIFPIVDKLN